MRWTDESHSDGGQVGATVECEHENEGRSRCSFLCTGSMEVFNTELWRIRLTLDVAIEKTETFQTNGVKRLAVFSDSQTTIL